MSLYTAGRPKNPPSPRKLLKGILPLEDMFTKEEIELYDSLIDHYLNDFKDDDLSASDIDDIASLAINKIMEIRILKDSRDSSAKQAATSTAIEKLRKHTESLKASLSTRRKDRVNPNEYKGFSIIDLAIAFDEGKRLKMENKSNEIRDSVKAARESIKDYGNRNDLDGETGVE